MNTYTLKPTTTEDFLAAVPSHATKTTKEPTYDDIRLIRTIIYENAASTHSMEPPLAPEIVVGATGPQISEANRAHAQALTTRRKFQNLDKALLRILMEAIEPLFLKPFHQPYVSLLGKTTQQVLSLFKAAYGFIMPHELEANRERLSIRYDATSEPFQVLIDRFEETRTYALDGGLPISDAQLVSSGIVALKNTGVLERFIDLWNDKPIADRTSWLHFKTHFQPRILEYQKGSRSTGSTTAFGLASYSCHPTIDSSLTPSNILESHQIAMAHMAATQAELLQQLSSMQQQFTALSASKGLPGTVPSTAPFRSSFRTSPNNHYCWTHGYRVKDGHNSTNCKKPAIGHQTGAIHLNHMDGNDAIKVYGNTLYPAVPPQN